MCNKIFCPETYAGLCNHIFWRYVDLQGVGTLPNPHVDAKIQNSAERYILPYQFIKLDKNAKVMMSIFNVCRKLH